MNIDLNPLYRRNVESIDVSGLYNIPSSYFCGNDIISIDNVKVEGLIDLDEEDNTHINCKINGELILPDSISLEEVNYPYSIDYDDLIEENCINSENLLDIFQFLWENIVLEVPLQFTKVKDLSKFHGDGWKLISEDELSSSNNPFSELLKDFKEE